MTTSWQGPDGDQGRFLRLRQRFGQPEADLVWGHAERQAEVAAVGADAGDDPERAALDAIEQHGPAVVRQAQGERSPDTGRPPARSGGDSRPHRPAARNSRRVHAAKLFPSRSRGRLPPPRERLRHCHPRFPALTSAIMLPPRPPPHSFAPPAPAAPRRRDQRVQLGAGDARSRCSRRMVRVHQRPKRLRLTRRR